MINPWINNFRQVEFRSLPFGAKKALIQYMAKDGEAWPLKGKIPQYDLNVGHMPFLYGYVDLLDFEKWFAENCSVKPTKVNGAYQWARYEGYSVKKPWPVILRYEYDDPPYDLLEDGWHRAETYLSARLLRIPALTFVPGFNHYLHTDEWKTS